MEPSWPVSQGCSYSSDCGLLGVCVGGKCVRSCFSLDSTPSLSRACPTGQTCMAGQCVLAAVPMTLTIRYPTTRYGYAFWLWLLMALVPAWTWFRMRQFEQQRTEDNS